MLWTLPFGLAVKLASRLPSAWSRAIRMRDTPLTPLKRPPSRIFPSDCTAILRTVLFRLAVKLVSTLPSALSRASFACASPPTVSKVPPMMIFPSACTATQTTWLFVLAVKLVSTLPSAWSRAMFACAAPPTASKLPPMIVFPSGCTAIAYTKPLPPVTSGSKSVSRAPDGGGAMTVATCTAAPLLRALLVTTAFSAPSVKPVMPVTDREVVVEAVTVPLPLGLKTTLLFPGVVEKLVPVIVSVVALLARSAVLSVTVGTGTTVAT